MAKLRHRIPHNTKVIYEQTLQEKYLLPGMVVSFKYHKPGIYDRNPLLFFMYQENNLIHGINLNYLNESRVQKFFKLAQSLTPMWEENIIRLHLPYVRLQLNTPRAVTSVDSKLLYKTLMPRDIHYKNAYRSYDLNIANQLRVVNYEVDHLATQHGRRSTESVAKRKNIKQEFGKTTELEKKQKRKTSQDSENLGKKKSGGY